MAMNGRNRRRVWSRHGILLTALLLNALFLALAAASGRMRLESLDDRMIADLLAGVYGAGQGCVTPIVSIALARPLAWLYAVTRNLVNWYAVLSVGLSFASITALCIMLLRRTRRSWMGVALCALLVAWLSRGHYLSIHYARNAALYAAAGAMLLVDALYGRGRAVSWRLVVAGVCLVVAGSLLYFPGALIALPCFALVLAYEIIAHAAKGGLFASLRGRLPAIAAVLLCALLVIGLRAVHLRACEADPQFSAYLESERLRADVLDGEAPDFNANRDAIRAAGLSRDDYYLLTRQAFLDRSVYTGEAWQALAEIKAGEGEGLSLGAAAKLAGQIVQLVRGDVTALLFGLCAVALLIYIIACTDMRRLPLLVLALIVLAAQCVVRAYAGALSAAAAYAGALPVLLLLVYYAAKDAARPRQAEIGGRVVRRIAVIVLVIATAAAAYLLTRKVWYVVIMPLTAAAAIIALGRGASEEPAEDDRRGARRFDSYALRTAAGALVVAAAVAAAGAQVYAAVAERRDVKPNRYKAIMDFAQTRPNTLFLIDEPTAAACFAEGVESPWVCFKRDSGANICHQGGWMAYTPANLGMLDGFGIENPYSAAGNGMRVMLVDGTEARLKLQYVRKHYGTGATLDRVGESGGADLYQFNLNSLTIDPERAGDGAGVLESDVRLAREETTNTLNISGYVFRDGDDSREASLFLGIVNADGTPNTFPLAKNRRDEEPDALHGRYGGFSINVTVPLATDRLTLYYKAPDGALFALPVDGLPLKDITDLRCEGALAGETSTDEYELVMKEYRNVTFMLTHAALERSDVVDRGADGHGSGAYAVNVYDAEGALVHAFTAGAQDADTLSTVPLAAGVYRVTVAAGRYYYGGGYTLAGILKGHTFSKNREHFYAVANGRQVLTRRFGLDKKRAVEITLWHAAAESAGAALEMIVFDEKTDQVLLHETLDAAESTIGKVLTLPKSTYGIAVIARDAAQVDDAYLLTASLVGTLKGTTRQRLQEEGYVKVSAFDLKKTQPVAFEIAHDRDGAGDTEYIAVVHDADCNAVAQLALRGTEGSRRAFATLPKGAYHVKVMDGATHADGRYTLSRTVISARLKPDKPFEGELTAQARAQYCVLDIDEEETVDIALQCAQPQAAGDASLALALYGGEGNGQLFRLKAGNSVQAARQTVRLAPGRYYLAVSLDAGAEETPAAEDIRAALAAGKIEADEEVSPADEVLIVEGDLIPADEDPDAGDIPEDDAVAASEDDLDGVAVPFAITLAGHTEN